MRTNDPAKATDAHRRSAWLAFGLLALSAGWVVLWLVHARGYWDDAAFVHLEFARSLSRGHGFRFAGSLVYGDSAPLWVCLLAGMHALVGDWMIGGKLLCALATIVALGGVYQLARQLMREAGRAQSETFAAVMVVMIAANPFFERWAFSGMQAVAAAGLACWALFAAAGRLRHPITPMRLLAGCMCVGVAPLLRPEMVLLIPLVGLVLFLRWVNTPLRFAVKLGVFFSALILVVGPVVAWSVYAAHVFGSAVPNVYASSVAAPSESTLGQLLRAYGLGFPMVVLGVLGLGAWIALPRKLHRGVSGEEVVRALDASGWMPFLWAAETSLFLLLHHTHVQTRYVLVSGPALTVAVFALARKLWPRAYKIAAVAGVVLGLASSLVAGWPLLTRAIKADRDYAALSAFVRTLPANDAVAANSIGEIAFLSEHPVVDMSGVTRPGVLRFRWDATDNRRVWWVHDMGACYMVLDHAPEPKSMNIWSMDVPDPAWSPDPKGYRDFEKLILWKLPHSPTLPIPGDMPTPDEL